VGFGGEMARAAMPETLVRGLLADMQRRTDLGPRGALFTAYGHHFGNSLCDCHFQGVEPAQNLKFPHSAIDGRIFGDVQLKPPYCFGR
jgi:hypothetical protein